MKILLKAGLLTLFSIGLFHGNASAESNLATKCKTYGVVKPNENPSFQHINCLLTNAARDAGIPPEVVKAVASQENSWRQFDENGEPVISKDGGIGLMQLTNQPDSVQDQLKSDIYFNIEYGVKILNSMYDRTDLPKIKGAGRQDIENWYFPVMAYNGTKPVNSPLHQDTKIKNQDAYQERVFAHIEHDSFLDDTKLAQFPFKTTDFQYDSNSDGNIVFLKKEYSLADLLHPSNYFFNKGVKVVVTEDSSVRLGPSKTSPLVKGVAKNTPLIINGNFTFDQSVNKQNQYVWYPVKMADQKVGFISSAYISTPTFCSQFHKNQKIDWNGLELKPGQLGRLTVLQNTQLFKLDGTKRIPVRILKKGGPYQIYAFKKDLLSVGGGYYVDRNSKVKYETPSKFKIDAVKCIAKL